MKRVNKLARLLALALVLCLMMAAVVSAAEAGKVWLSVTESANGEDTVALVITDTTVTDGLIKVTYDSSKLTYKSVMVSSEHVAMHAVNAQEAGVVMISWVAPEAYQADGTAITLIEVHFTGTAGEDTISVTGAAHNAEGEELAIGAVDNTALEEAVADAGALKEEDYTSESWSVLESALEAAGKVLKDPTATQEEVDAAARALTDAVAALEEKQEDPSVPSEDPSVPSEDPTAPSEDPTVPSQDPTAPSEEKVDTAELEKSIAKAKSLNKKDYTSKSYKAMEGALKLAEAVLKDADATQQEVDNARKALDAAIKALVPTTGKNPETGDSSQLVLVSAIGALSLVGIGALVVMNNKNKKNGRYAK